MEAHFATSGYIVNQEGTKVLMVFHKKLNIWVVPGGHLEPNESPVDGVKREVFEETGIMATIYDSASQNLIVNCDKESQVKVPYMMLDEYIPERGDKPAHRHMDFVYLGRAEGDETLKKQETEVSDAKWMTFDEVLESGTFDSVKEITKEIINKGSIDKL